jgi:PAS domain S-box-containing protein
MESGFESESEFRAAAVDALTLATHGENAVGVVLTWNPEAQAQYGHSLWEIVGHHSSLLVPRDLVAEADALRERVLAGETVGPYETKRLHRDGHAIAVALVVSPVRDPDGRIAGTLTVTHPRLPATEDWLEQLVARSDDVFYRFRLQPDVVCEFVSPAIERLTGYTPSTLYGDSEAVMRLMHPEDRTAVLERLASGETGPLEHRQMRWLHRDGSVIQVGMINVFMHDREGRPTRVVGVARDVTTQEQDEQSLREANKRLELALEATLQGMFEVDLSEQMIIHSVNLAEVFGDGFPEGSQPIDRWLSRVLPDDVHRLRILWQDVSMGRRDAFEHEYRIGTRRGVIHWFRTSGRVVATDDAGSPTRFLGLHTDVTQLREVQQAQFAVEQRHWSLFENLAQGVIYYDALLRPTEVNPAAARILGLPIADLRDRSLSDHRWRFRRKDGTVMPSSEFPATVALKTGRSVDDVIMRYARGPREARILVHARPLFAPAEDRPTGVLVAFTDVTALWEAKTALGQTEERYRLIVENTPDVIARHDRDGRYEYITPNCERFFGVGPDAIIGRLPGDIGLPVETAATMTGAIGAVFATGEPSDDEFDLADHEGTPHHFQWRAFPEYDGGHTIKSVVAILQDVTGRRRLEEQFLQSQKMEAVGRLAGGVAHDFNNLLTGVQAYVSFLLSALPEGDARRADAEQIEHAANRAAALTRQLLAFSRRQVMQPRVLDLTDVVSVVEAMLRRIVGEDIILTTRATGGHGSVRADPGQMEQVILNLVVNARDAMPAGGSIEIAVSSQVLQDDTPPSHSTADYQSPPGHYVTLSVTDTGPGIPEELHARVFEPFFTTKEQGRGTGLGLSTVYGIVKQSGGHIVLDSEVGRGSTFTVYLPRTAEVKPVAPAVQRPEAKRGDETILLVEDDEMVRTLAVRTLRSAGFNVIEAKNGEEALEQVREHGADIDLVLTDVIMPGMNGRQLIETIARTNPGVPYLFMSGYTDDVISQQGIALHDAQFLEKPFTPAILTRRIREVLGQHDPAG